MAPLLRQHLGLQPSPVRALSFRFPLREPYSRRRRSLFAVRYEFENRRRASTPNTGAMSSGNPPPSQGAAAVTAIKIVTTSFARSNCQACSTDHGEHCTMGLAACDRPPGVLPRAVCKHHSHPPRCSRAGSLPSLDANLRQRCHGANAKQIRRRSHDWPHARAAKGEAWGHCGRLALANCEDRKAASVSGSHDVWLDRHGSRRWLYPKFASYPWGHPT